MVEGVEVEETHGRGRGDSKGGWMMIWGEGPHGPEDGRRTDGKKGNGKKGDMMGKGSIGINTNQLRWTGLSKRH